MKWYGIIIVFHMLLNCRDEGVYRIRFDNNEIRVDQETKQEPQSDVKTTVVFDETSNCFKVQRESYLGFGEFFNDFVIQIRHNCSTQKQADAVFQLCETFAQQQMLLCASMLQEQLNQAEFQNIKSTMDDTSKYISEKLQAHQSQYKRLKILRKNPLYVEPETKMIGVKWKTRINSEERIPDHNITQATFEYVPIIKTLKALFSNLKFADRYFSYNQQTKHDCIRNEYQNFCCGELYSKSELFQQNPNAVQIELSVDDFEVCSPLKSKATIHKVCAVYFRIRNMPPEFNARLNAIYMVALCLSDYIKAGNCSFNDIAQHILAELQELENGIEISPGNFLKGTLITTIHDNLGGNQILGFVESFVAENCCRICEASRTHDFQTMFKEDSTKRRRISSYENQVSLVEASEGEDNIVKGVKRFCVLNDLRYYHMLKNTAVDLMHDVNEGVVPFFIQFLFTHMIENGIANLATIQALVRDFNYGVNNQDIKPSLIKLKKRSLGQSASQILCVMKFLPFILFDYKNQLAEEWEMMNGLLEILQILYSYKIREVDLTNLENLTENHLKGLVERGLHLIFKHHMLIHYPNVIRRLGPVLHSWMMRFEAKHKESTTQAHNTNNFINITKSLAYHHQEFAAESISFENKIEPAKNSTKLTQCSEWNDYADILCDYDLSSLSIIEFLRYNSFTYRRGQLFLKDAVLHRIKLIFQDKDDYLFVCQIFTFEKCNVSIHCFKINEASVFQYVILNLNDLNIKKIVDEVVLEENVYFIAETLDKLHS